MVHSTRPNFSIGARGNVKSFLLYMAVILTKLRIGLANPLRVEEPAVPWQLRESRFPDSRTIRVAASSASLGNAL